MAESIGLSGVKPMSVHAGWIWAVALWVVGDVAILAAEQGAPPIPPAASLGTGLLLEPPLDLSAYTREQFIAQSSTVGTNRIGKAWTKPVLPLPPHPRPGVKGLTEAEVKEYMLAARETFERGEAMPVSDVGLVSTQEDVIRRPMLNHIAAFSNDVARVYLLVQKTSTDKGWSYYSIVQDVSVTPAVDYFAEAKKSGPKLEAKSCYKCHASGPLAIHPAREDLILDAGLAAAINQHIAGQPRSRMHFPKDDPADEYGEAMAMKFCTRCHSAEGDRAPLHRTHSHSIRVLVDFGYMPPNRRLKPEEVAELKAWLEKGK